MFNLEKLKIQVFGEERVRYKSFYVLKDDLPQEELSIYILILDCVMFQSGKIKNSSII